MPGDLLILYCALIRNARSSGFAYAEQILLEQEAIVINPNNSSTILILTIRVLKSFFAFIIIH